MAKSKPTKSTTIAKRVEVATSDLREATESKLDEIVETSQEMNLLRKRLRGLRKDGQPYHDTLIELSVISEVLRAKADSACAMIDEISEAQPN